MKNISTLITSISQTYLDNLSSLKIITKKIRNSSMDYYDRYKSLKKDFLNKRRELKAKTSEFEETTKINLIENKEVKEEIKDFRMEAKLFKEKAQIEISEEKQDLNNIAEILDSLVQDVNIFEGLENEDAINVSDALNLHLKEKNNFETDSADNEIENEVTEQDVLLERMTICVNELYEKKKICLMEVKSLDNKIYSFGNKCVILNLKDEKIYGKFIIIIFI